MYDPGPYIELEVFPSGHRTRLLAFLVAAVTYLSWDIVNPEVRSIPLVPIEQIQPSYDFIVVGGGSAGCVVASRLSANPNWTVLLIEAGLDETIISQTPLFAYDSWYSYRAYNTVSTPQQYACRSTGGICTFLHGRGLGGSSSIMDNYYLRGNPRDYDIWAERGNSGWSYQEVLPYFRLSEGNEVPELAANTKYHGSDGPFTVGYPSFRTPLSYAYLEAGRQLGYPTVDIDAGNQTGFARTLTAIRNGSRCSASRAFLQPARLRPNLHVSYSSTVTKVLIGEVNKTAFGVQFLREDQMLTVYASKEIIMSAGGFNSPQLLMLSGVGPAEELKQFNIPVIADLPVGKNFQDKIFVLNVFHINQSVTVTEEMYESPQSVINFALGLSSPLTMPLGCEVVAYMNINSSTSNINYPGAQFTLQSAVGNHRNNLQLFFIVSQVLHPLSMGNLTLASTSPFDDPLVNPNMYAEHEDFLSMVEVLKTAYRITQTPALQAYGAELYLPLYPSCNELEYPSTEFWTCMAYQYGEPPIHPSRTCAMGPADDPTAVVDPRLRVYGINNLRVIDASIMPTQVSSYPNAATLMVAERACAFIFEDYNVTNPSPAV